MIRRLLAPALIALTLPGLMAPAVAAPAASPQAAPLSELVKAVAIPHETFTLPNGLTTIVHTDRKAPVVSVVVYYRVGSKHEPRGRTGFAHLYEHLFFGGSENVENFDKPLEAAGSTSTNGSTWYDRTNYFQTVPTGALDLALFMESDRMGHLLGAVTQDKLDKQRGVVQNEKRQGDNEPYGLFEYALTEGLLPVGHPYRHSTIGSMADLDAATLADVRQWYYDNYGPNNVVLVLSGDIDAATAQPKVERWFGAIARGPQVRSVAADPVTLAAPVRRDMADQVPVLRITRNWTAPGLNHPDAPALDVGMRVLGGLASSRLDNALVRGEEIAVSVTASAQTHEQLGFLQASMDVKPGVDRALAEARLDALIADFVANGPSEDEMRRAVTSTVSAMIGGVEMVLGKGMALAEGQLYSSDPEKIRTDLARMAALTPADVRTAMQRWLNRPTYALAVVPGERTEKGEAMGGYGDEGAGTKVVPDPKKPAAPLAQGPKREAPPVAPVADLAFPQVERARLSNGIPVTLARRSVVPKVLVNLSFDAGIAADALDAPGTQAFMLAMLDEGTATRNATQIAEEQERLGASLGAGADSDASGVTLSALSANLAPSLALLADVVRNPAFATSEVARVRAQRVAQLAQIQASPPALARRELGRILFGPQHPYGQPADGLGDMAALAKLGPDALKAAHARWLRPDLARITITGDITMDRLLPMLEAAFGNWRAPKGPAPVKDVSGTAPQPAPRIILIDRPNSPQSVIAAGRVLDKTGRDQGLEGLELANEVLGDGFLSRLNSDLREEKGWSYGVRSAIATPVGWRSLRVTAPVQADRTGDSIRTIIELMQAFPGKQPVTADEMQRVTDGNIRGLPNRFETNAQVLNAIVQNERLGRPDNYYATLASLWRKVDAKAIDTAARTWLQPQGLTFVVVGDRRVVEPQLAGLGLPVEVRETQPAGN